MIKEIADKFQELNDRFERFLDGTDNEYGAHTVSIEELDDNVKHLNEVMDRYFELLHNKKRLFFMNFAVGLVRGVGFTLGATVVVTLLLYLLGYVVDMKLPVISDWVGEFIKMVEASKNAK